jgi:hypothetical protein
MSDDAASFFNYWSHDDGEFAEEIAKEPSETSDEEELLSSSANNH